MSVSIPKYEAMALDDIFKSGQLYTVPTYQRGYAWEEEQVTQLLDDLILNYGENPTHIYLLGQSIVCLSENKQSWEIVDGQQRITTLYLLITRVWHSLKEASKTFSFSDSTLFDTITSMVFNVDNLSGGSDPQPRLLVAKQGQSFVKELAKSNTLPDEDENLTQENIRTAIELIDDRMKKDFPVDVERFRFLWFVIKKVVILRLELSDVREALQVFQKMNNRGLALDDADLLKNLLFINSDEDEFLKLSKSWDEASTAIFKSRLKRARSMEFLMKAMIGVETGSSIPTSRVFETWEDRLKDKESTHTFASSLSNKAKMIANASNMKSFNGDAIRETPGTHLFKWVQHFEVLLAGMHLDLDSYKKLCTVVDTRAMLSMLSGEKNQEFEREVHKWAHDIASLPSGATHSEIIHASKEALGNFETLIKDMRSEIPKFSYNVKTQQNKIRYTLTRIAQYVERGAVGHLTNHYLFNLVDPAITKSTAKFHLDHIFPKSDRRRNEWPDPDKANLIQTIGNLILLHPDDNEYQSDALPNTSIKKDNIAGSKLLINQAMCSSDEWSARANNEVNVLELLREDCPTSLANWGASEVESREKLYLDLLERDFREVLTTSV